MYSRLVGSIRPLSTFIQKAKVGYNTLPSGQQELIRGFAIAASAGLSIYIIDPFNFFKSPKKSAYISDVGLKLESQWFYDGVKRLETAIKITDTFGFNENLKLINDAEDVLRRLLNLNNFEVMWRLGRILVEQSFLAYSKDKKKAYLDEAEALLAEAEKLQLMSKKKSLAILKWRAICLISQYAYDKKVDLKFGQSLLEKALEIETKDPYIWYYMGLIKMNLKKYEEAKQCFTAATAAEPNFSSANCYNIGLAEQALGNETKAIETMKNAMMITPRYNHDIKAMVDMRSFLSSKKVQFKSYYDPY